MSATFGSSASPCALARRRDRNTSLRRRARCTSSLNVSDPNSSLAVLRLWAGVLRSEVPYSLMLRMASLEEAEPMDDSFREQGGSIEPGKHPIMVGSRAGDKIK